MLVSLANYKAYLGTPYAASTDYDSLITTLAQGVETSAAQFCGRIDHLAIDDTQIITFAYTTGLQHHVHKQRRLQAIGLPIWPVAKIDTVAGAGGITAELLIGSDASGTGDFTDGTSPGWELHGHDGTVHFSYWLLRLLDLYEKVTVNYSGGYIGDGVTPVAGATALPADLRSAFLMTVKWMIQHKGDVGVTQYSTPGGVILSNEQFPPQALAILKRYRNGI